MAEMEEEHSKTVAWYMSKPSKFDEVITQALAYNTGKKGRRATGYGRSEPELQAFAIFDPSSPPTAPSDEE